MGRRRHFPPGLLRNLRSLRHPRRLLHGSPFFRTFSGSRPRRVDLPTRDHRNGRLCHRPLLPLRRSTAIANTLPTIGIIRCRPTAGHRARLSMYGLSLSRLPRCCGPPHTSRTLGARRASGPLFGEALPAERIGALLEVPGVLLGPN